MMGEHEGIEGRGKQRPYIVRRPLRRGILTVS